MTGDVQVIQAQDKQDSVEINRTSTGKTSFSAKLYFNSEKTSPDEQAAKVNAYLAELDAIAKKYEKG